MEAGRHERVEVVSRSRGGPDTAGEPSPVGDGLFPALKSSKGRS